MAITDYASLQQAIVDWANTPEVEQAAPTFIQMAEAKFNRELRVRDMLTRATITSNVEFLALPLDWVQTYSLEMPDSYELGVRELKYVGLDEVKRMKPRT